jgi:hypothetical protein
MSCADLLTTHLIINNILHKYLMSIFIQKIIRINDNKVLYIFHIYFLYIELKFI